jgi:hypothetical protein
MSERKFDTLVTRLQPSVPGCPFPTIMQYVRNSAIRTCERTLYWRHAEAPYALTEGVHQYFYKKPANSDVHAVFMATVNGYPLARLTLDKAVEIYPQWADLYSGIPYEELWGSGGGFNSSAFNELELNGGPEFKITPEALEKASTPQSITQVTPDQFIVLPLPDDNTKYIIRLIYALKPKRAAVSMPAYIFDELEDTITHGALQELLVLPNVPWSDRELASYHAKQYSFTINERRARANLGNVRGSMAAKMQPFM